MEIREIIKKIKKHRAVLLTPAILGLLMGLAFFYIPPKYTSSGSIYINRKIDEPSEFFTYEGYYAQQSALGYTNSVSALIESTDVQKELLERSGEVLTSDSLRNLQRKIKVRKVGPQVIFIEVKEKTPEKSEEMWVNLTDIVISKSEEINREGDSNLYLTLLSSKPLVKETYRNIYTFSVFGLILGSALGLLLVSIKEYLKK